MTVPISNMTQVFANSSITYNAIGMNIITGGQAGDSTILNLKANGTLVFSIDLAGTTTIPEGNINMSTGGINMISGNVFMTGGTLYVASGNIIIGSPDEWGPDA